MRIAVFEPLALTTRPNAASHIVQLQNQIRALANRGNSVALLAQGTREFHENNVLLYQLKGIANGITPSFSAENTVIPSLADFFSPDILLRAARWINREIEADVLYSCGTVFSTMYTAILASMTQLPSVHYIFYHGFSAPQWWRGDSQILGNEGSSRRHRLRQFMIDAFREIPRRRFLERWAVQRVSRIATSSFFAKEYFASSGFGSEDFEVVYPGVELPNPLPAPDFDHPIVTYFGHLWQGRGVLDLLQAFARISEHFPKARLLVANNNSNPQTEYQFNRIISSQGIERKVIRVGVVKDIVKEVLAPSSFVVLPYRDTPSMKLLESLAAGRAVITTRIEWTPELIVDGQNGFLVDAGDVEEMTRKMRQLLSDPSATSEIAKNARRTAESRFDIRGTAENLEKILWYASSAGRMT